MPDRVRLTHMLEASREAIAFMAGRKPAHLASDRLLLFGVVKAIEIVGEAARCVTDQTRALLPRIPWAAVVGMRHRVVHVYFDIDPRIVWDTVSVDLPPLIDALEEFLGVEGA